MVGGCGLAAAAAAADTGTVCGRRVGEAGPGPAAPVVDRVSLRAQRPAGCRVQALLVL